jgi:hypothetical protein
LSLRSQNENNNTILNTSLSSIDTQSTKIKPTKSSITKETIDLKGDEYLFSILGIREELEILKSKYPNTLRNYNISPKDKKMIVELDSS